MNKKIIIIFICLFAMSYASVVNPRIDNGNQNDNINWAHYVSNVERNIKKNWHPPKNDTSKKVVVIFTIGKDGKVINKRIVQSSGIPIMDKSALDALDNASPFAPLPSEYKKQSVPIEFTFDYNVLKK